MTPPPDMSRDPPQDAGRLRQVFDSAEDFAIMTLDPEGRVELWNAGATRIFGWTEQEMAGRSADVVFTPEDRAAGAPEKERAQAARDGRAADERWHLRRDGSRFYASGVMRALRGPGGITGFAKIARDLTERQLAADALREARDLLEVRVADRTRDLADANESLRRQMHERDEAERERERLLRQLVNSLEAERERVARDLHDHLGQRMSALTLKLGMLRRRQDLAAELRGELERLEALARATDNELDFIVWELRPRALDELGLVPALGDFVAEWSTHFGVPASFSAEPPDLRLVPEAETVVYRVAQEALNNVAKHAHASHVEVQLGRVGENVRMVIQDDGVGFDPAAVGMDRTRQAMGLAGMRERSGLLGARLDVHSAPGKGARVELHVHDTRGPGT